MQINIKKIDWKNIFQFILLVAIYWISQLKFLNDTWFGTDELDIMWIGKAIAKGKLLYVDVFSQHMPFSYYISAFFAKMGFDTVSLQRCAFYFLFAVLWAVIVFNYSQKFNKYVLMFFPYVHFSIIQTVEWGTQILSEHLAGIGGIILLLEFLVFCKERQIQTKSCVFISVAIVLMFGTIFMAIFPIFFVAIGVLFMELLWKKESEKKWGSWFSYMIKKYMKLIMIVALPWIVLLGYYVFIGGVKEFIFEAYTMNTEIYPKYNGGVGSNILGTFFAPIENVMNFFVNGFSLTDFTYSMAIQWLGIIAVIIFAVHLIKLYGGIASVITLLYVFSLGIRGIYNFHGIPCIEVIAFIVTYVLIEIVFIDKNHFKTLCLSRQSAIVLLVVIVMAGYGKDISELTNQTLIETNSRQAEVVKIITDKDEEVGQLNFSNDIIMQADRLPIGSPVNTPWTWEAVGKEHFKRFKKEKPRVVIYNPEHECWGYYMKDYAPEIIKYMEKHYTALPNVECIYIVNEYYDEACKKLEVTQ